MELTDKLKILLTNYCLYDGQNCVNRRTSNVPRARFTVAEVVKLTADFYLRSLALNNVLAIANRYGYDGNAQCRTACSARTKSNSVSIAR